MPHGIPDFARPSVETFMRSFTPETARRGEEYFAQNAVEQIEVLPDVTFAAKVNGTLPYEVLVSYDEDEKSWSADCDCPTGAKCKHIYALMLALRGADAPPPPPVPKARFTAKAPRRPSPFEPELTAALGRPLAAEEARYLGEIGEAFARAQKSGGLRLQDFVPLGFQLPGFGWDRVALWPEMPPDERTFWLYVVLFLEERGVSVPEFMLPVSDPAPLRETVAEWKREETVNRWKKLLSHLLEDAPAPAARTLDLRVRFRAEHAVIEGQREGDAAFAPLKLTEFYKLAETPFTECTPVAALMLHWFTPRAALRLEPTLPYVARESSAIIGEMLRAPWLADHLVNEEGFPLQRPEQPLRWEIETARDEHDDYRVRLVEAEGAPAGPFLLVSAGAPTLYLTRDAVFAGPVNEEHAIAPGEEVRIPAPALESGHGVRFLRHLGLELPERVRERVRTVEIKPRLRCEIAPTWAGAKEESCMIEAIAEADDASERLNFTPDGWRRAGEAPLPDTHVFYERSALALVPAALEWLPLKWDVHAAHWHFKVTRKFAEIFSAWLRTIPAPVTLELRGELESFQTGVVAGTIRLEVEEAGVDWFDLRVVLDVSDTQLTKAELKLLLDARGGWVRLVKKGWRRVDFQLSEEDDEQLARLGLSSRDFASEPQRLHALQLADKAARRFLPEEQCDRLERRAAELHSRVTPEIPSSIRGDLRPYQREGFHFLAYLSANHFGGILADDMGLGKTLQTLTWLAWLREQPGAASRPSLVVCPKSVTDNWRAEVEQFVTGLRVRVWGSADLSALPAETASADLHVINYAQLRSLGKGLARVEFLAVILDEGQFIKNPSSITAQIARGLRAGHRLVLSGTPIENKLLDLWSLMAFAMPGALGNRASFAKLYDSKEDPYARRRLAARVRPFVLRRTKAQVAKDLPDRVEEDLHCEMEGEQKALYRAELKRAQQMLLRLTTQKQLAQEQFHVLTSLLRLRQICCHPRLIKPESQASSAKVEALLETLEPLIEEGQKVLVFSQFVGMLDLLREALTAREWPLFYLAGATENRGELIREFQAHEGAAIFLISLKAGGFGLNLTAASYVVLFDPWWNPAVENQAIDRTHRIGQTNKVIAYRLLIKDSIEDKIRVLQKTKRALADDILGEEKFAQSLTLNDLQFLFAE